MRKNGHSEVEREPRTEIFYLVVFREQQQNVQQKILASVSNLIRFMESEVANDLRGFSSGEYDVYYVNIAALEVSLYDLTPLRALVPQAFPGKKKGYRER